MKLAAGRGFSKQFGTDTTQAMVINESTAKLLGYTSPQQAIEETLTNGEGREKLSA
jgi:putative ABC transport system permease protein